MTVQDEVLTAIEASIAHALARPGLYPELVPVATVCDLDGDRIRVAGEGHAVDAPAALLAVLQDGRALAAHPANAWPDMVRELWRLGLVLLRDEASSIDPSTSFSGAFRTIIERTSIGAFCVLKSGPIVLCEASIEGHAVVVGPIELAGSGLGHHTYAGTCARIRRSFLGPFVKAHVGVDLDGVLVASHAALDGGQHADFMPFAGGHAAEGVRVGPQSWIGQQASLVAGASLGRGVVVATATAVSRAVGDHHFVAGTPARDFPIDWHLRHLDAHAARAAGRAQGPTAAMLPIYGTPRVAWRDAQTLAIDCDYDGGRPLAEFHAGALEALFARLVPGVRATVERETATDAAFRVTFDRAVEPHVALDADLRLELRGDGAAHGRIAAALPATVQELVTRAVQERWSPGAIGDTAAAVGSEVASLARAGQLNVRLSQLVAQAFCRANVAGIEAALATGAPAPCALARILGYLRASRVLGDGDGDDEPLISSGRIDSFGLAALLNFLEDAFGITVDIEQVTVVDFDRASGVADYVSRRRTR